MLKLSHGTLSISNNTPLGQITGASANGRKAWMPLSDGISPTQGADTDDFILYILTKLYKERTVPCNPHDQIPILFRMLLRLQQCFIAQIIELCVNCGACVAACPQGIHRLNGNGKHEVVRDLEHQCTGCSACQNA